MRCRSLFNRHQKPCNGTLSKLDDLVDCALNCLHVNLAQRHITSKGLVDYFHRMGAPYRFGEQRTITAARPLSDDSRKCFLFFFSFFLMSFLSLVRSDVFIRTHQVIIITSALETRRFLTNGHNFVPTTTMARYRRGKHFFS